VGSVAGKLNAGPPDTSAGPLPAPQTAFETVETKKALPPSPPKPCLPPPRAEHTPPPLASEVVPAPVPEPAPEQQALEQARCCNNRLECDKARELLLPYASSTDACVRCALALSCLRLADDALLAKPPHTAAAKEYAAEAVAHATAATSLDAQSAEARVWYGQSMQVQAKVLEGGMGQARVCAPMVHSWDAAVELAPQDPLAYHLLGSFAFHTSALPWVATKSMQALSPGLRRFTAEDAIAYLKQSEERLPALPRPYAVQNRSMLGRLYLKKGDKAEARKWLDKALELAADSRLILDHSAKEAAADAKKARAKC